MSSLVLSLEATGMMHVEAGGRLNCLLQLRTPAGNRRLVIELKRKAYPREVRDAVWKLESFCRDHASATYLVLMVATDHLSDGAKDGLRHQNSAVSSTKKHQKPVFS